MKEWICGKNPVFECLRAGRRHFFRLIINDGAQKSQKVEEIKKLASSRNLIIEHAPKSAFFGFGENHQGIALQTSAYPYVHFEDILNLAEKREERFFVLLLDQIQDPQNLGTLIRSAEIFGVHGILMPASRATGITPAVVQSSSGACESLLIAQGNMAQTIDEIRKQNGWVIGLDMDAASQPISDVNLTGNIAIVVGSEGEGLRQLVKQKCDYVAHIPMKGTLDSLNAAVAGSIALYCASLQRNH